MWLQYTKQYLLILYSTRDLMNMELTIIFIDVQLTALYEGSTSSEVGRIKINEK
jgi:hypothetical protein